MKANQIEQAYTEWRAKNPLKAWRHEHGVSAATVCAATGVTTNSVVKWEQGATVPSDDNMEALAALMGMTVKVATKAWLDWIGKRPAIK